MSDVVVGRGQGARQSFSLRPGVSSASEMNIRPSLVEFPAEHLERARRFSSSLLDAPLAKRTDAQGSGWQTHGPGAQVGVHERGRGPGDSFSLP
jgi:hypothetical protein